MKITKSQLKRVIKEELQVVLKEGAPPKYAADTLLPYVDPSVSPGLSLGQKPKSLEGIHGFQVGDVDLANVVRQWKHEVSEWSFGDGNTPSGTDEVTELKQFFAAKPGRIQAYETLIGAIKFYDEVAKVQQEAIANEQDPSAAIKKYEPELKKLEISLKKSFPLTPSMKQWGRQIARNAADASRRRASRG